VNFDVPEAYQPGKNEQCMTNCDQRYQDCYDPGPNEQECWQFFEECREGCEQQDPECENRCEEELHICREGMKPPEDPGVCELILEECTNACEKGVVYWSSLKIFMPPISTDTGEKYFGCDDLSFGEVDPAVLDASLMQEVILSDEGGQRPFSGVPRKGLKVLLAQAFDSSNLPVVAACTEIGEIDDDIVVRLRGEPAAVLTLVGGENQEWFFGAMQLPDPVELLITDAFQTPLANWDVKWNVVGPAGTGSNGIVQTGMDGRLDFSPQTPASPGPSILEIVTRWQRGTTPLIKAFTEPGRIEGPLPDYRLNDIRVGRIGPAGQVGYAGTYFCGTPLTSCLFYAYYNGSQMTSRQVTMDALEGQDSAPMGIIPRADYDRVIVAGWGFWLELDPAQGNMIRRNYDGTQAGPVGVMSADVCDDSPVGQVLIAFGDGSFGVFGPSGGERVPTHPFSSLQAPGFNFVSGCVADQDGIEHRLLIGEQDEFSWRVVVDIAGRAEQFDWAAPLRGIGFSPSLEEHPAHLVVGRLGQDSPEIARMRVLHQPGIADIRLDEISAVPLFAVPEAIGAGHLDGNLQKDGDLQLDVMGLFPLDGEEYFVQAVLGRQHRDKPVSGMMPAGLAGEEPPRLFVADFDSDAADDFAVMRVLECNFGDIEQCLHVCEEALQRCLEEHEPQFCEELYVDCTKQCGEGQTSCIQFMDIYLMGS
jgi:hypothetical protein